LDKQSAHFCLPPFVEHKPSACGEHGLYAPPGVAKTRLNRDANKQRRLAASSLLCFSRRGFRVRAAPKSRARARSG
jgi:hypothetical protein